MAHILLAEDDQHISRVIALWLKRNGHQVIVAFDGNQALEMVRRDRPDLLVTDVNMPGLDGLNLLETIRAESLMTRSAIVLTSRCDQEEIEARAGKLGAEVHPKPFSPQRLMEAIESALSTEGPAPGPLAATGGLVSAEHD
jgi:DNA-binding response OmpR family regulator